jgi:hypothetical protein
MAVADVRAGREDPSAHPAMMVVAEDLADLISLR